MAYTTPYRYDALNEKSYKALATHVASTTLEASFYPKLLTIVVTPKEDEEEAFKELGMFIDAEGLDLHIDPIQPQEEIDDALIYSEVTPSCLLRNIVDEMKAENKRQTDVIASLQKRQTACETELNNVRQDRELYSKWHNEESCRRHRLEETIKALRTLLNMVIE